MKPSGLSGKSALVCSNSLTLRKWIGTSISAYSVGITEVSREEEVLVMLQKTVFDLVFIDSSINEEDSDELLKKISSTTSGVHSKVIFVTGSKHKAENIIRSSSIVKGLLIKPFTQKQVVEVSLQAFSSQTAVPFRLGSGNESLSEKPLEASIRATIIDEMKRVAKHIPCLESTRSANHSPEDYYLKFLASNRVVNRVAQVVEDFHSVTARSTEAETVSAGKMTSDALLNLILEVESASTTGTLHLKTKNEVVQISLFSGAVIGVTSTSGIKVRNILNDSLGVEKLKRIEDRLPLGASPIPSASEGTPPENLKPALRKLATHLVAGVIHESTRYSIVLEGPKWKWATDDPLSEPFASLMIEALRMNCIRASTDAHTNNLNTVYKRKFTSTPSIIENCLDPVESWSLEALHSSLSIPEAATINRVQPVRIEQAFRLLKYLSLIEVKSDDPLSITTPDAGNARILLLTKTREVIELFQDALKFDELVVAICDKLDFAVHAIRKASIQVVVTDGITSEFIGFGKIAKLREINPELTWIALEPENGNGWIEECIKMKPDAFIPRPYKTAHIKQILNETIAKVVTSGIIRKGDADGVALNQIRKLATKESVLKEKERQLQKREIELWRSEAYFLESCNKLEEERVMLEMQREEFELFNLTKHG